MKLYISVDMEGIAGIFNFKQEQTDRERIRSYVYNNVEWVIKGIQDSNLNTRIEKITVIAAHAYGNILTYDISKLDDRIYLYNGLPQLMIPDITKGHNLMFLVGYHPGSGSINGGLSHTFSSHVHHVWLNGVEANETIFIGAIAAKHNIPIGLIVGDDILYQELKERTNLNNMKNIHYVITKHSKGRHQAEHIPMNIVKQDVIDAVKKALRSNSFSENLVKIEPPYKLKLEFNIVEHAEVISKLTDLKRIDGYTIEKEYSDIEKLYKDCLAMILMIKGYNRSLIK